MSVLDAKTSSVMLDSVCSRETLSSAAYLCWVQSPDIPGHVKSDCSTHTYLTGPALRTGPSPNPAPGLHRHHHLHSHPFSCCSLWPDPCGLHHQHCQPELLFHALKCHSLSLSSRLKYLCDISSIFLYTGQLQQMSHSVGLPG